MSLASEFFFGVVFATLIGIISGIINANWSASGSQYALMFTAIPQPKLQGGQVKTDISESPVSVLSQGCFKILGYIILVLAGVTALVAMAWAKQSVTTGDPFLMGVFYTGIFGLLMRTLFKNWQSLRNAFARIVNPPNPTLKKVDPPNQHVVTANPTAPACSIFVSSAFEVGWRLLWTGALISLITLTLSFAADYITEGAVQVSPITFFDV